MNSIIYLLVALGSFILAIQNSRSFRSYTATGSFVLLCMLSTIGFGSFGLQLLAPGVFGLIYPVAVCLLPAALMGFLVRWLKIEEHTTDNILWGIGSLVGAIFLLLHSNTPTSLKIGAPEYLLSIWFVGSCVFGLYWLWTLVQKKWEDHRSLRLKQLFGLILTTIVALLIEGWMRLLMPEFDLSDLSSRQQIAFLQGPLPPIGAPLAMLTLYILHLNVKLTRMISLHELFSRLLTHAFMALLMSLFVGLALLLDGDQASHTGFQIWLIALLFVMIFSDIQGSLGRVTRYFVNRQGSEFEQSLKDLEATLNQQLHRSDLDSALLCGIHDAGRTELVSLYYWNPDRNLFERTQFLGIEEPIASIDPQNVRPLLQYGTFLNRVDVRLPEAQLQFLGQLHADVCFPFWSNDTVIGWMALKIEPLVGGFSRTELARIQHLTQRHSFLLGTISSMKAIAEHDRLTALGTMAGGLSNELKPSLESIQTALSYLKDNAMPDEVPLYLSMIEQESNRLQGWLHNFNLYAHTLTPLLEGVDINQSLVDTLRVVHQSSTDTSTIEWSQQLDERLPSIEVDPTLFGYVWKELLENAIDSLQESPTKQPKKIQVITKLSKCQSPQNKGQPAIEVRIEDSGIGISKEHKENIFIPFFTTKERGGGLGLAMVRRIVQAHNAEVQVLSAPNEGTSMIIRIPIWNA